MFGLVLWGYTKYSPEKREHFVSVLVYESLEQGRRMFSMLSKHMVKWFEWNCRSAFCSFVCLYVFSFVSVKTTMISDLHQKKNCGKYIKQTANLIFAVADPGGGSGPTHEHLFHTGIRSSTLINQVDRLTGLHDSRPRVLVIFIVLISRVYPLLIIILPGGSALQSASFFHLVLVFVGVAASCYQNNLRESSLD